MTKRFGGLVALHRVDLQVEEGEVVGLIGPNGAGKSTLFGVLSGFLRPDEGRVRLLGRDITGRPPHEIARLGVARTFQTLRPFPGMTVLDNLELAALPTSRRFGDARLRARRILELLQMEGIAHRLPSELPTGHLKMLEVGKALATAPRVVLLDEPFAGLNPQEVESFTAVLRRLAEGGCGGPEGERPLTMVLIEHVMRAVMAVCRRVVVLHHGEKIADGAPEAVARDPAVLAAYLGRRYAAAT